jgi:AraC-like DNA-binding protein
MEIKALLPRRGEDTLRIDDSDDLVVIENIGALPEGGALPESGVYIENHALVVICTEGMAQFEYDGQTVLLRKNDMFIYLMLRSVITNYMSSQNFNCRQIWFTNSEAWSIDMHGNKSVADLIYLKQHPKFSLTDPDAALLDDYFRLLCHRMRDRSSLLYQDIVRSLFSTLLLEILAIMRRGKEQAMEADVSDDMAPGFHRRRLADKFMRLVEHSEGRIRKVDEFANQLNVTPKYLSTLLKETMNRRPSEIIHFYTLKAIKHRLRFTDMTMQEVANDLRFPNASFFGKYFKEHTGMTPLEFRMKYQKGN